jgi:hypothetical protein
MSDEAQGESHDRATGGKTLTREERDALEAVYAGGRAAEAVTVREAAAGACRGSILIISNRAPAEWPSLFGDPRMASAALDRLADNANVFDHYRLQRSGTRPPGPLLSKQGVDRDPPSNQSTAVARACGGLAAPLHPLTLRNRDRQP